MLLDEIAIQMAKTSLHKEVAKLSKKEVFGAVSNGDWNNVLGKYLIIDMFECTGASTLDQCEVDCLVGKLKNGLTNNCC